MVSFPQRVIFAKWSEYAHFAKPSGHTHRVAQTLPLGYSVSQAFQLDVIGTLFAIFLETQRSLVDPILPILPNIL